MAKHMIIDGIRVEFFRRKKYSSGNQKGGHQCSYLLLLL